jgi:hypothetical protein
MRSLRASAAAAGFICCTLAWPATSQQAVKSDFVALIIANGLPGTTLSTDQPAAAAREIEARLRQRGFKLVAQNGPACSEGGVQTNLGLSAMKGAVSCLAEAAKGAKQALVYFAGYAVQLDGKNYLVHAGADTSRPLEAAGLLEIGSLLETLEKAAPGVSILIVDGPRGAAKSLAANGVGLAKIAASGKSRAVAFSAPAGLWADEAPAADPATSDTPKDPAQPASAAAPGKPYAARLASVLDKDLDMRSLGLPGLNLAALLANAANPSPGAAQGVAEYLVETNAMDAFLGNVPKKSGTYCETLTWRAETFGNCLELAAAFEQCGLKSEIGQRLSAQCPKDLEAVSRLSLRSALAGAMKTGTCAGFTSLFSQFDSNTFVSALGEYKEAKSLGQYKCSIEAQEKVKAEFERATASKDCAGARKVLASGSDAIDADMRTKLQKLVAEVCCPKVSLRDKCISRGEAVGRFAQMLAEKGCTMGRNKSGNAARALVLMEKTNKSAGLDLDLKSETLLLDPLWAKMQQMNTSECACKSGEKVSNAGVCARK